MTSKDQPEPDTTHGGPGADMDIGTTQGGPGADMDVETTQGGPGADMDSGSDD